MKEFKCVQVGHHKNIARTTDRYIGEGWNLHTYQAAGGPNNVVHYLLFERETSPKASIY